MSKFQYKEARLCHRCLDYSGVCDLALSFHVTLRRSHLCFNVSDSGGTCIGSLIHLDLVSSNMTSTPNCRPNDKTTTDKPRYPNDHDTSGTSLSQTTAYTRLYRVLVSTHWARRVV